jgi:hypothetical protein
LASQNQEPYDLEIKDNGKITFYKDFTGYESLILITSFTKGNINNTQKDVISPLTKTTECCESEINKLILEAMPTAAPIKNVLTDTDESKPKSYKVVTKIIAEQECKFGHDAKIHQLSIIRPDEGGSMTSETLVEIYQTTQRNNPEDSNLQTYHCENLKSYICILLLP